MKSNAAGFSILEALIAFVILAAVLSVLLPSVERMVARTGNANELWLAHELAASRLALLRSAPELKESVGQGREGEFVWEITVRPESPPGDLPAGFGSLERASLIVRDEATGRVLVEFETLLRRTGEE